MSMNKMRKPVIVLSLVYAGACALAVSAQQPQRGGAAGKEPPSGDREGRP